VSAAGAEQATLTVEQGDPWMSDLSIWGHWGKDDAVTDVLDSGKGKRPRASQLEVTSQKSEVGS
jgi:hypothetical protein